MKVYFIGAGPGAADLITVRGAEILRRADLVLYAGSLVSEDILQYCREDTASSTLLAFIWSSSWSGIAKPSSTTGS